MRIQHSMHYIVRYISTSKVKIYGLVLYTVKFSLYTGLYVVNLVYFKSSPNRLFFEILESDRLRL